MDNALERIGETCHNRETNMRTDVRRGGVGLDEDHKVKEKENHLSIYKLIACSKSDPKAKAFLDQLQEELKKAAVPS